MITNVACLLRCLLLFAASLLAQQTPAIVVAVPDEYLVINLLGLKMNHIQVYNRGGFLLVGMRSENFSIP